mmetsp:Transcript_10472/g.22182  ORF Transcript_10472/g.22182 Transcript_10472/m.22182 type:complete len:160 (+) Transcript_10472:91-570(+)
MTIPAGEAPTQQRSADVQNQRSSSRLKAVRDGLESEGGGKSAPSARDIYEAGLQRQQQQQRQQSQRGSRGMNGGGGGGGGGRGGEGGSASGDGGNGIVVPSSSSNLNQILIRICYGFVWLLLLLLNAETKLPGIPFAAPVGHPCTRLGMSCRLACVLER